MNSCCSYLSNLERGVGVAIADSPPGYLLQVHAWHTPCSLSVQCTWHNSLWLRPGLLLGIYNWRVAAYTAACGDVQSLCDITVY